VWWTLKRYHWYSTVIGPIGFATTMLPSIIMAKLNMKKTSLPITSHSSETLNLQPGDWIEVRSLKEIFTTLNTQGKLKGLRFTPEMTQFCGRRFKVYKRLNRIILEARGELREIKTPTVLLEDVFCDGKAHGGCDRACFCFWREAWLKRTLLQHNE